MTKRSRIQRNRLEELESDFESWLTSVLKESAAGRWGLFGQNDSAGGDTYLQWPAADAVKSQAEQIHDLRKEFGEPNPLVERFLDYCSLRGASVSGEPKLARLLLDEIESHERCE